MKRLMLIGFAVCAIAVMPTLPTTAMPFAPLTPAVTQADENVMLVKRGGRGHHYGWSRSRGRHLGFTRGRHRGWR